MKDREFLVWLLQRLYAVHHEPLNVDYMLKLASIIDRTHPDQCSPNIATAVRVRELVAGLVDG